MERIQFLETQAALTSERIGPRNQAGATRTASNGDDRDDRDDQARSGDPQGYWTFYRHQLARQGWLAAAMTGLDSETSQIMEQLADPSSAEPRPTRGAVLHYPGSGHAANTVGVIAKSIDYGYRLVIVLAGTHNVTRRQVQERLDEQLPSLPNAVDIVRLTNPDVDYHALGTRLSHLEFEKQRADLPLNTPENLRSCAVRLIVVKKNVSVLRKLLNDLRAIYTPLDEIPTLILDMDTKSAPLSGALDKAVARVIELLPRAQYVAYTSDVLTPSHGLFGNFEDQRATPDYIVMLARPQEYLGTHDFYDPPDSGPLDQRDLATSGERAYVRRVEPGTSGWLNAMDMFVLTGAMKIFREDEVPIRWHTMVVYTNNHDTQQIVRTQLDAAWRAADYQGQSARDRLRRLFEGDVLPVSRARTHAPLPASFDQLLPSIDTLLVRVGHTSIASGYADFRPPWAIFVFGAKAVNGMLAEGLTILYLQDPVQRTIPRVLDHWFGFRPGYADLVRLYIPWQTGSDTDADSYALLASYWQAEDELRTDFLRFLPGEAGSRAEGDTRLTVVHSPRSPLVP
jgi:hypothetical protein